MKRTFISVVALMLAVLTVFTFTACTSNEPTAQIPEGYKLFDNGAVSFAYPDDWSSSDNDGVAMLVNPSGAGNNITVASEVKSDLYKNMTTESFATELKPTFESYGMTVSGARVEQLTNKAGTALTKISFNTSMNGVSMTQTMLIVPSGIKNYIVTVTETSSAPELVENALDTLEAR